MKMDCEGCEKKVQNSVRGMKGVCLSLSLTVHISVTPRFAERESANWCAGVTDVRIDPEQNKLTVTGFVTPAKVLKRVIRKTGKKAEIWPYVPYTLVDHPYVLGVYDRKAPPGYVRNTAVVNPEISAIARAGSEEARYVSAFSDENPNACTIM